MLGRAPPPRQKGDTVKREGVCGGVINLRRTQRAYCVWVARRSHTYAYTHSRSLNYPASHLQKPVCYRFHTNKTARKENMSWRKHKKRHCRNKNQHKGSILSYNVPLFPEAGWGGLEEKTAGFRAIFFRFC